MIRPTIETAQTLFHNLFFNAERYDLSRVGRLKLNYKFKIDESIESTILSKRDILETVRYLIELRNGRGLIDDIDHLGNRRVRAVGELMENQYRIGLVRMERAIKERMSMSQEIETLMPHDLINAKPVSAVVKEYFGSSQLSQFMDQTNPLSEVTHKRRLSALGPGGLTRERAGFEVRDVHPTHYGRICPIETPEGPNIGLIASLSTFARVNEFGFIETPYRAVEGGKVSDEVQFYSALQEEGHDHRPGQRRAEGQPAGRRLRVVPQGLRRRHDPPDDVTLMDVSPNQLVSVAASLIPFLEHDDANRALMGSNMQRQAVPLVRTMSPLVGTGMEGIVARDSGVTVVAKRDGMVEQVDAARIVVRPKDVDPSSARGGPARHLQAGQVPALEPEHLHQPEADRPARRPGQGRRRHRRRPGDRERRARARPERARRVHAVGRLQLRGLDPRQRAAGQDDVFTSIHIEEFECVARDTKLGKEEITRDIPNVGEEALKDLDESGIVRIGAEVKAGDILVGKITPKGETQLSPEEKLLRAIFGEKAGDVRDTSLRVPPGVTGIVIDARVFARKGAEKDERAQADRGRREATSCSSGQARRDQDHLGRPTTAGSRELLLGKTTASQAGRRQGQGPGGQGRRARRRDPRRGPAPLLARGPLDHGDGKIEERLEQLARKREEDVFDEIETSYSEKIAKLTKGDELPPGVIKMVKVYVAIKRKLSGRRQDGRPPRQQGRHLADPARGGHAVPRGRHAGRHRPQPAGRAVPHERRPDPRDPPGLGGARRSGNQIDTLPRDRLAAPTSCKDKLKKILPDAEADRSSTASPTRTWAGSRRSCARASTWRRRSSTAPTRTRSRRALKKAGLPQSGQAVLYRRPHR